jgi:hypothetical protein
LEGELLYDLPTRKEVEAIAGKSLEYVVHPSVDGMSCSVDFRIKVLTTQHQNNFFIIRAALVSEGERLEVSTNPIKSVSKPEQIRRRLSLQQGKEVKEEEKPSFVAPPCTASKKRARSEELLTTLDEMKEVQRQQTEILTILLQKQFQPQPMKVEATSPLPKCPTIEEALALLIRAYEAESCAERPMKLRKLASSFPIQDKSVMSDIGRVLSGLQTLPPETTVAPVAKPCSSLRDSRSQTLSCNQFPLFDLSSVGVDMTVLNGDDISYLNDSLYGWIQQGQ